MFSNMRNVWPGVATVQRDMRYIHAELRVATGTGGLRSQGVESGSDGSRPDRRKGERKFLKRLVAVLVTPLLSSVLRGKILAASSAPLPVPRAITEQRHTLGHLSLAPGTGAEERCKPGACPPPTQHHGQGILLLGSRPSTWRLGTGPLPTRSILLL